MGFEPGINLWLAVTLPLGYHSISMCNIEHIFIVELLTRTDGK